MEDEQSDTIRKTRTLPRLSESTKGKLVYGAFALSAAIKIWLVLGFGMRAGGDAREDDRLFMSLADAILAGKWLGVYDQYTLVKGPFFSIWIAATFLMNIPLLVSYQLLHLAACVVLVTALRPIFAGRGLKFGLFLWLLFDPTMYSVLASWVVRDSVSTPMTIVILAGIIALLTRLNRAPRELIRWSLLLGATLAAYWTTREESIWIVPGSTVALAYALFVVWKQRRSALVKTMILILPAGICVCGVLAVCALNYMYYGVFETVEFKDTAFKRANGALMRVEHEKWEQYAIVPQEVRLRIYKVSPAFAELQRFLEGPPGEAWGRGAEYWLDGGTPNPRDIRGGFFVWALRDAVADRGYYASAPAAKAYYNRVADEINAACEDGRLKCGRERASMMPPWRNEYIPLLANSFSTGLWKLVTLDGVDVSELPSSGPMEMRTIFGDLGRARLNPDFQNIGNPPNYANQTRLNDFRFGVLTRLNSLYRVLMPFATVSGVVAFVIVLMREVRSRSISPILVIGVVLVVSIAARMVVLGIISVTSFDAMKLRYMAPLYPILLLFSFLSVFHFLQTTFPSAATARSSSRKPSEDVAETTAAQSDGTAG